MLAFAFKSRDRALHPLVSCLNLQYRTSSSLHVQVEPLDNENEGIFLLSLTRPDAKNAIGRQLLHLKERAAMTQQEAAEFVTDLRATFNAVEALPMPTVAVVDGYALGGGAELALACDLRVSGAAAQFAFPETRLGIIPGAGGTQRLPRVVGRTRAKELIFTGRRINAQEAVDIGLVDFLAEEGASAEQRGLQLARDIAKAGPIALRMAKSAINQGSEVNLQAGLQMEEAMYARVLGTQDRLEGLKAFAEKRTPQFTGQ
ncbi:hypothetical protein WJX72_009082 [[Myrmecia] bisecta]|uniref:Enoyl-CoA hydratase n=1 Tax=[Myrmecia] bisecta TaxID=41462 RepID=A0AAW1Q817_9CHLO